MKYTKTLAALALAAYVSCAQPNSSLPPASTPHTHHTYHTEDRESGQVTLDENLAPRHRHIQTSRFVQVTRDHSITFDQYRSSLTQRFLVHQTLESELEKNIKYVPEIASLYTVDQKSTNALSQDLEAMGVNPTQLSRTDAYVETTAYMDDIISRGKKEPVTLLGDLFVLYGAITHGGPTIAKNVKLAAPQAATSYYGNAKGYDTFQAKLEKIDPIKRKAIENAATASYSFLNAMNNSEQLYGKKDTP